MEWLIRFCIIDSKSKEKINCNKTKGKGRVKK